MVREALTHEPARESPPIPCFGDMQMRCPVCRAENVGEATCRRCKADLSLLVTVEQARAQALAKAAHAAALGDGVRTLQFAEKAHRLRRDADSWRWLAVGGLLVHDFVLAAACWRQVTDQPGA